MKIERCSLTGLIGFIATLIAVVLLSKIGGTGSDLAIMTGLIGVLGMLAPGLVPSRGNEQRAGAVGREPFEALDVALLVEVAVGIEVGQREREQAGAHDVFEFLRVHRRKRPVKEMKKGLEAASAFSRA